MPQTQTQAADRRDTHTLFALVAVLALLGAAAVFLPQGDFVPAAAADQVLPPLPLLALANAAIALLMYGSLGYLGVRLSPRVGVAAMWDESVSNVQRFALPAGLGIAVGIVFIVLDRLIQGAAGLDVSLHPPFPLSLVASATAGIGEEILFRLVFITVWTWLISNLLLRGRAQAVVFWVVAVFAALAFAAAHLPSVMLLLGVTDPAALGPALLAEIVLLNGLLSLVAAWLFRRYGFLAAVGVHFWADVVWHVVWGLLS